MTACVIAVCYPSLLFLRCCRSDSLILGAAASGTVGLTSLSTTIASLASLAVFLIPLIALLLSYDSFIGSATLLGLSFTAISYLISLISSEKSKAAGGALITWFLFALVFYLGLLALLVGTESSLSQTTLRQLMMLNPADVCRLVNLAGLDSSDVNGALAVAINANLSQVHFLSVLLAWIAIPLTITSFIFKNKKL